LTVIVVVATAIATLSSGLVLYGAGSEASQQPAASQPAAETPAPVQPALVHWVARYGRALSLVQVLALFAASAAAAALASLKPAERWAANRTKAEVGRREIFDEVLAQAKAKVATAANAAPGCGPLSQAFEFFRRYQLELQHRYYAKNADRHDTATRRLTWLTSGLAGLAGVTGAIAGLGGSALIVSAFLGIAVPILLSAAQSWRVMSRDTDKAGAYAKARDDLAPFLRTLGATRAAAASGDATTVQKLVDEVHLVMATESDSWLPAAATP
jgi:hypothetical protein